MAKIKIPHPPFDWVLLHRMLAEARREVAFTISKKKDSYHADHTVKAFGATVEIRENELEARPDYPSFLTDRGPQDYRTGRRSLDIERPLSYSSRRKFNCTKEGWDYDGIVAAVLSMLDTEKAQAENKDAYKALEAAIVKEFKVPKPKYGSPLQCMEKSGAEAKLSFSYLTLEQVRAILHAAQAAGVEIE